MDRIVIDGCRQHRPEQIIEFLGLQSGQPYDRQQMQLIAERLWNCARFHKYQLRLDRDAGGGCTLRITLNETPGVPILSEPLSEVAEAMLKTRAWLSECDNRGEDLVFRIQKGAARCLLIQSRSGMIVQTQGTGSQDAAGSSLTPSSLLVDGDQLLLALGDSTNHWSAPIANYPGVIRFELGLGAAETDDKFAILNLGFNFHSQRTPHSPLLVHNLNLTPAAWCAFAYKPDCKVETTDQTITLSRDEHTIQVDRQTGQLLRFESFDYQLNVQAAAFDQARQQILATLASKTSVYDDARPLTSLVQEATSPQAVSSYRRFVDLMNQDESVENQASVNANLLSAIAKLTQAGLFQPLDAFLLSGRSNNQGSKFEIPDPSPQPTSFTDISARYGAKYTLKWLPDLFAEGSWPMQLGREACLVLLQRGQFTGEVLNELALDQSASPLRDSCLAALLMMVNQTAAKHFANRALQTLEPEGFDRDLQQLLSGTAGKWFTGLMEGFGQLSTEEFESLLMYAELVEAKDQVTMLYRYASTNSAEASAWYQATHETLQSQLQNILRR